MKVEFPKVNNKLAFFDFDRTLVAHSYSKEFMAARQEGYMMECYWALTALDEEHKNDRPLPCMQWFARKLYEEGYGLYCLTHEIFNLHDGIKQKQLKQFYGNAPMTYLTVDKPEHKVDMMKAVAMIEGCELSDIIFVDDLQKTVTAALAEGIDARHLSDIVVLYESQKDTHEQDVFIKAEGLPGDILGDMDAIVAKAVEETETAAAERSHAEIYEECRRLAEMNGRGREGGATL